jgi:hypothetical protein
MRDSEASMYLFFLGPASLQFLVRIPGRELAPSDRLSETMYCELNI